MVIWSTVKHPCLFLLDFSVLISGEGMPQVAAVSSVIWENVNFCGDMHLNILVWAWRLLLFCQTLICAPSELLNSGVTVKKGKGFLCKPFCQCPGWSVPPIPPAARHLVAHTQMSGPGSSEDEEQNIAAYSFSCVSGFFLGWGPGAVFGLHFCTVLLLTVTFALVSSTYFWDTAEHILICRGIQPVV